MGAGKGGKSGSSGKTASGKGGDGKGHQGKGATTSHYGDGSGVHSRPDRRTTALDHVVRSAESHTLLGRLGWQGGLPPRK